MTVGRHLCYPIGVATRADRGVTSVVYTGGRAATIPPQGGTTQSTPTDCGPDSLVRDIGRHGPYQHGPGVRSLDSLAAGLARIVLAVHERGVVMHDLSPANIVLGNGPRIIDFGLAAHGGLHIAGGTPGYAPARQLRDEPPSDTDDLYALGMVLLFAATGLHPVTIGEDPELPRVRALQTIRRHYGATPSGVIAAIVDLLGEDGERARTAVRQLAEGSGEHRPVPAPSCPEVPDLTAELAAEIARSVLDELLDRLNHVLEAPDSSIAGGEVSLYFGSAGIGLELLHHRQRHSAVDRTVRELAAFTARVAGQANQSPGLFSGATGTDLFLWAAAQAGLGAPRWPGRRLLPPDWQATPVDLIEGQAGVGLGHLWFYQATGDSADLAVARQCVATVSAERLPARESTPGRADAGLGRAHGLAGAVELLIGFAAETADPHALQTAADHASHLAALAETLAAEAEHPTAEPMTLSWCRGLSGIGQTLLHASTLLGESDLPDLTRRVADACVRRSVQLNSLGQCCGAVGVGNFLLDVAARDQSGRYRQAAFDVAAHLLLRSGGPPERPRFVSTHAGSTRSLSWAQGLTGILGFFRRLANGCPTTGTATSRDGWLAL
ncbi:MAG TPA: lanthionine synthetase LanC family protein [Pseudonocardiaceae bacterium]|nr:lanthionine synthetase LanC family protein [Pseudonocardiaceae bacterium]